MNKVAFKMYLKPGCKAAYIKRHAEIWPELRELLKNEGISDYSIFLDEATNTLFAVQDQSSSQSSQDLADHAIVRLWWQYMADIMETNPDSSPVTEPLEQVFYME
jgi:L-rhamnose mutarotase